MDELTYSRNELYRLEEQNKKLEKELIKVERKYDSLVGMIGKVEEKEDHPSTRLQDMIYELFNKQLYSDLTIHLSGGHSIYGHKLVLASKSDDWCDHHLEETDKLDLTDLRYEVAFALIKWIYTGEIIPHFEDDILLELLQNSVRFRLEDLHLRTQKMLITRITANNCNRFYEIAEEAELLKESCLQFMSRYPSVPPLPPPQSANSKGVTNGHHDYLADAYDDELLIDALETNIENYDPKHPTTSKVLTVENTNYYQTQNTNRHVHNTIKEKKYQCQICNAYFVSSKNLKTHHRTHTGERPFKCDVCDKAFAQKNTLSRHMLIHSGERPYKCDVCSKSFKQPGHLDYHVKMHTGNKSFKCSHCEKTFITGVALRMHARVHSKDQPFKCSICDKGFKRKSTLKDHLLSHSGVKAFKCDVCNKFFSRKLYFLEHKKTHTDNRPYKCEHCDRAFSLLKYLRKHSKIHENQDRYKCTECYQYFNSLSNLNSHMAKHSQSCAYKCDICNKTFRMKKYVIRHMKIHEKLE